MHYPQEGRGTEFMVPWHEAPNDCLVGLVVGSHLHILKLNAGFNIRSLYPTVKVTYSNANLHRGITSDTSAKKATPKWGSPIVNRESLPILMCYKLSMLLVGNTAAGIVFLQRLNMSDEGSDGANNGHAV